MKLVKNFKTIILIVTPLFLAQKSLAQCLGDGVATDCIPDCVANGTCPTDFQIFIESSWHMAMPSVCAAFILFSIIFPIIIYRKYGCDRNKRIIILLAYFPLLVVLAAVFGYFLRYAIK